VQVDPINATLKPTGTKRLNLICDDSLSSFSFHFKLRCYSMEAQRIQQQLLERHERAKIPTTTSAAGNYTRRPFG
jgi:hypothetical protein